MALWAAGGCAPNARAVRTMAPAPSYQPAGQNKCSVGASRSRPLIVEWPSHDRAALEAQRGKGTVVVSYQGCEMNILRHCSAPGAYSWVSVTPKEDRVSMKTEADLYANIPMNAVKFEGTLQRAGELNVAMTIVGLYESDRPEVGQTELVGRCDGATHVVAAISTGAFEFYAGGATEAGAAVKVGNAGAGGNVAAAHETLTRDGDTSACRLAHAEPGLAGGSAHGGAGPQTHAGSVSSSAPPVRCGAMLRLEVVPLGGAPQAAVEDVIDDPSTLQRKALGRAVTGLTLGGVALGLGVGAEVTAAQDSLGLSIGLGSAATVFSIVGGPVAASGRRTRQQLGVQGVPGLRIGGWVAYGLGAAGAVALLGTTPLMFDGGGLPPGVISSVAIVTVAGVSMLSAETLLVRRQSRFGPRLRADLRPVFSAGRRQAFAGIAGRF